MRSSEPASSSQHRSRILFVERLESRVVPGFLAPLAFDAGVGPVSVAVGDFNGDGHLDLAVDNGYGDDVSVLLGNADGTFQTAHNFPAGTEPRSMAVGDFDGDGHLDLAVTNYVPSFSGNNSTVNVLLGNGDGSFQAARAFPAGKSPSSVAVGDFDGDGH